MPDSEAVALLLAALACGEDFAVRRARRNVALAPDARARKEQEAIAAREQKCADLVNARLREIASERLKERFRPYFETFHNRCAPADWIEAQALHYLGDALASEFGEQLASSLDPVSAEVVWKALGGRDEQEVFSLEELQRAIEEDPAVRPRIAAYAARISGEALTQTTRALDAAVALRDLLGGAEGEKALLLRLLEQHRIRLDRLGIDVLETTE